jgi:hypothetical protein
MQYAIQLETMANLHRDMGLWPMVRVLTHGRWYTIGTGRAERSSLRT